MTTYATLSDLAKYGLPSVATSRISSGDQQAALDAATAEMNSYFRARYGAGMPFTAWGEDVKQKCCEIAQFNLLRVRGFNPQAGADVLVKVTRDAAIDWCKGVERQTVHPDVTLTPAPYQNADAPLVLTTAAQGWIPPTGQGSGI